MKAPIALRLEDALQTDEGNGTGDMDVLSVKENAKIFLDLCTKLANHPDCGTLMFDKDFEESMRFVSAAANLRMYQFYIDRQSFFKTKGVAGNIVHAIATTNAIVSAAMVMEAIKVLTNQHSKLKEGYINDMTNKRFWV